MKYYKIGESIDGKEIGTYPQIQEANYNFDPFEDKQFIDNLEYKKINFLPKFAIGKLHKKAKLTNLLSAVPMGFSSKLLINSKLKEILASRNNENYQIFNNPILVDNVVNTNYWLLNPTNFNYENINFKESEIYLLKDLFTKVEILEIKSPQDLINEQKRIDKLGYPFQLHIEKLVFDDRKTEDFVIIDNTHGGIGYFVSERLKKDIEDKGISGIKFDEA